jgi:lipopolysaccharide/colanic/teichoic acid biosynthesis glycosyltransferase
MFKDPEDPRITKVGKFIRKYSIDELPQIFNVLKGDMSLVGPRPPLPSEVKEYEKHVHRRLHVKPGITGIWQVSGRTLLSWQETVRMDLTYVENWTISSDLLIILRTVLIVAKGSGT